VERFILAEGGDRADIRKALRAAVADILGTDDPEGARQLEEVSDQAEALVDRVTDALISHERGMTKMDYARVRPIAQRCVDTVTVGTRFKDWTDEEVFAHVVEPTLEH
jgi:hypothetical protein